MEVFEVHITGDERIHEVAGVKTIAIQLLRPDFNIHRIEHMTSQVVKCENYQACLEQTLAFAAKIPNVVRVKIECPYYPHYVAQSLYMESHADDPPWIDYPISRNANSYKLMATDRVYDQAVYDVFRLKWAKHTIELCLYDTNVEEDKDWFSFWKQQ